MSHSVRIINREFSPAEAATITGVSTALQRDWRRRDIIKADPNPEGKWTRWTLADIIRLSVMKLFSDVGMEVSSTSIVAGMAIMPTLSALAQIEEAVEFSGADIGESEKMRLRSRTTMTTHPSHVPGRFLAWFGRGEYDVCRADSLSSLEEVLDQRSRSIMSIVDCRNLASLIANRAGGPVIIYEINIS